jgi:ABC-type glucose/galactose transport system permease subunit
MLAAFVLGMTLVLAAIVTDVLMAIRRLRVGDIVHRSIIAIWGGWFLWDRLRSGETLWAGLPLWAEATLVTRLPVAGLAYLVWALRHARRECAKHVSGNAH